MEIITVGFLVFWIGVGALVAMVVSLFTSNMIIQTSVFVITSSVLMFLTRPLTKKFIKQKDIPTNIDYVIGKTGLVTTAINSVDGTGQIKIDGETWSAKTNSEEIIPEGSEVEIIKIEGVKAVVKTKIFN